MRPRPSRASRSSPVTSTRLVQERGRAVGVTVDGCTVTGDVIIDASGRASRFTGDVRPPAQGGDCGAVYVTRQYRLRRGAAPGPVNSPIGLSFGFSGYLAIAFVHDGGHFSITFTHDGSDIRLRRLRHDEVFDDAVRAIPRLAEWIEPARAQPISAALPGGRLYNTYRGQLDEAGRPVLPGFVAVGDAVCTTTPLAGRGVALALMQARELVRTLDQHRDRYRLRDNRIRPLVRRSHSAMVRRPSGRRCRSHAPMGGRGRRPAPSTALGPHRRGRRGGPVPAGHRRPLRLDGRIARKPRTCRAPR